MPFSTHPRPSVLSLHASVQKPSYSTSQPRNNPSVDLNKRTAVVWRQGAVGTRSPFFSLEPTLLPSSSRLALRSAGSVLAATASQSSAATSSGPERQSWEDWMKDWRPGRKTNAKGLESLHILPGWAVQRYVSRSDERQPSECPFSP